MRADVDSTWRFGGGEPRADSLDAVDDRLKDRQERMTLGQTRVPNPAGQIRGQCHDPPS
jgi:hypothetical protein